MRKIAIVIVAALSLGGCAALDRLGESVLAGGKSFTAPIQNPVGRNERFEVEAFVLTARRSALSYMRLRQCRKSETASYSNLCARHAVKEKIRNAEFRLKAALAQFRQFMRENPTVSAWSAAGSLKIAVANYKAELAAAGVN